MNRSPETIASLAADLASGRTTARWLVEAALDRIENPQGEGHKAFLVVASERARAEAEATDQLRAAGAPVQRFAGIPIAVKDLFDVATEITTAGSLTLADSSPALNDATVVARLRAAGFIVMGRTNMTEFAFSGLGLNPHFDAPASPWDRSVGRIPGGSSSGSAVAVADGMVAVGLGTDTGGSCRIPAAFCSVVGFKPTARRVPMAGTFPLSPSLDSVGPLARSVQCCATVDHILAGGDGSVQIEPMTVDKLRLAAITDFVLDDLGPSVSSAYHRALSTLRSAGVEVVEVEFPELVELPAINASGGLAPFEAYQVHRELLAAGGDKYDPLVRERIEAGALASSADNAEILNARKRLILMAAERLRGFDAFVLPTVAVVPPTFQSFAEGGADYYRRMNGLCLRNTAVGNFLDTCSISLPLSPVGAEPAGLMLMGRLLGDDNLFQVASTVETQIMQVW